MGLGIDLRWRCPEAPSVAFQRGIPVGSACGGDPQSSGQRSTGSWAGAKAPKRESTSSRPSTRPLLGLTAAASAWSSLSVEAAGRGTRTADHKESWHSGGHPSCWRAAPEPLPAAGSPRPRKVRYAGQHRWAGWLTCGCGRPPYGNNQRFRRWRCRWEHASDGWSRVGVGRSGSSPAGKLASG